MDVSGGEHKVQCCKEPYCTGAWNVRPKNQGKLDMVKQEMPRVNIDISEINELKWMRMGKFNSDDHYIYYCGQESLRKNQMLFPEIEFQRKARRDQKAFSSEQCKEIEENNRMRKTRDLFKKIGDTKGTYHTKMGTTKGQKWQGLNRSRRDKEGVERIHKRTIQKSS